MTTVTLVEPIELSLTTLSYDDISDLATCGKHCVVLARIEPDVARAVLANNNARNRQTRGRNIKFLKEQIGSGRFVYNGETIVFGDDGNLNNGQHRLIACGESENAIDALLVFGVPADRFVTYDQGASRSGADVLSIEGQQNCGRLAAALRHIDNFGRGKIGDHNGADNNKRMDNAYVLELLSKHPGIELSVSRCSHFPRTTRPSLAAALHYLFSKVDAVATEEFFNIVEHGIVLERQYDKCLAESAVNLREWLHRNVMSHKKSSPKVVANVWIKAWNGYRKGKVPKVLMFKDTEEQVEIL